VNRAWYFGVPADHDEDLPTALNVREYVLPQVLGMVAHGRDRGVMGDWAFMAATWWPEGGAM
jgi:hypothetical protein